MFNWHTYLQGGAGRRPGTKFVKRVQDYAGNDVTGCRGIPFSGSDGTRWSLIIMRGVRPNSGGSNNSWFFVNALDESTEVMSFGSTSSLSSQFASDTWNLATKGVALQEIQFCQVGDQLYLTHRKFPPIVITYDSSASAGSKFAGQPYNRLASIVYTALAGSDSDRELMTKMPFQAPVFSTNDSQIGLVGTGTATGIKLVPGTSKSSAISFDASWLGRQFKFTDSSSYEIGGYISNIDSASQASFTVVFYNIGYPAAATVQHGNSVSEYYEVGYWSPIEGYPGSVMGFEQRLAFGGSTLFPDYIWWSELQDTDDFDLRKYESDSGFSDPVVTTDPFTTVLTSDFLPDIKWMRTGKTVTVGTDYEEFILSGPNPDKVIGFDNIRPSSETAHGSIRCQPVKIDNTVIFLGKDRKTLKEMYYNRDENAFKASNLNFLAPDIASYSTEDFNDEYHTINPDGGFVALAVQNQPQQIVWALDANGTFCSMVRDRQQEVLAWSPHRLAGEYTLDYDDGGGYDQYNMQAFVQSLWVNQRPADSNFEYFTQPDEVWMLVTRAYSADGSANSNNLVTYLERLSLPWERRSIEQDWNISGLSRAPIFMDCTYLTDSTIESTNTGVIENLPHTHGETVHVVCNGRYFGEYTVDEGSIDISDKLYGATTWSAMIGLNYIGKLIPNTPEVPAQTGSSQGRTRRTNVIVFHFYKTLGVRVSSLPSTPDQDDTPPGAAEEITFPPGENQTDPVPLYTGDIRMHVESDYGRRERFLVESFLPLPAHVTHMVAQLVVYE